jgi:hypothetical protein
MSSSTEPGATPDPYGAPTHEVSPADAARNPIGSAALVVAILQVLWGLVQQTIAILSPSIAQANGLAIQQIGLMLGALGVVGLLLALIAAVLGLAGITRPGRPHRAAAAALGIGVAGLVGGIFALAAGPIIGALLA